MFAFVLMPFDPKFDDVYKLGIKETCAKLGISAERVDEQICHKENILERIYNQINAADFIISDMTGRNPNVFYETGYAQGKGKICLLLTSNADDIPFDLKHHRHVIYGNSIQGLRPLLEADLQRIAAEISNRQSVITLELTTSGMLEKSEWAAKANIDFRFDLRNKTSAPSPTIHAIHFYTGHGWSLKQDGQPCPKTKADFADFADMHFVRVPVTGLPPAGWAQVTIEGLKYVAYKTQGPLPEKYRLSGRAHVRIMTSDGLFDYPVRLDLEVEEFPF